MIQIKNLSTYWNRHVDHGQESLLNRMERLEIHLLHLRCEGKPVLGKNIKNTRETLQLLAHDLFLHTELEEKAIFPFLGTHVPRLDPVIRILQKEHHDFKKRLLDIRMRLHKLAVQRQGNSESFNKIIREIQEIGNFMIHYVKNHLKAEDRMIHNTIRKELHPEEEKLLRERVYRLMRRK